MKKYNVKRHDKPGGKDIILKPDYGHARHFFEPRIKFAIVCSFFPPQPNAKCDVCVAESSRRTGDLVEEARPCSEQ